MKLLVNIRFFKLSAYFLGIMIINCFFLYGFKILTLLNKNLLSSELREYFIYSILIIMIFYQGCFIKFSRFPISHFGFTTKNWRESISLMNKIAFLMMIVILLIKLLGIHYHPAIFGKTLFTPQCVIIKSWNSWLLNFFLYITVSAPVQSIIIYGGILGPFADMLLPYKRGMAFYLPVVTSSALFSVVHLIISLQLALAAFLFCFICGLVYQRHRTLIGQIYVHIIVGVWLFFIVGFPFFNKHRPAFHY